MSDEEQWKARILVNSYWDMLVTPLNERTSKVIFLSQQNLSEEELALPFDGALYFPPDGLRFLSTEELDEEAETFEKFVSFVGLEGKCLALWVDPDDWDMKDSMFEKLRLKERNCEWCWEHVKPDEEEENALHLRLCNFFEENTQQCQVKPAKR